MKKTKVSVKEQELTDELIHFYLNLNLLYDKNFTVDENIDYIFEFILKKNNQMVNKYCGEIEVDSILNLSIEVMDEVNLYYDEIKNDSNFELQAAMIKAKDYYLELILYLG